jgi:transposase
LREQVVLEPTSTYHHLLVQALARAGLRYKVINPAHTKAFAQAQGKRAKTDQVDARLLAAYGESQKPEPSPGLDEAQEELKALRRHLEWLEDQAQMVRGRLEAARHSPWTPKEVARSLERTLREREEEVGRIKEALERKIAQDERWEREVRLVESIPGIGWRSAVLVVSEMPSVGQCSSAKSWAAFYGVHPAIHQSGKASKSKLSRAGAPRLRRRLFMAAVATLSWNPSIRALNQRLKLRGKTGMQRVMAAMHKLLRQCFGVLKTGSPFNPQMAIPLDS